MGGRAALGQGQGGRAARGGASGGNELRGRVTPARKGRIDGISARTIEAGGTGDRVDGRREEGGRLRCENRSRSSTLSSRWSTGVSRMSPKIRTKVAPIVSIGRSSSAQSPTRKA